MTERQRAALAGLSGRRAACIRAYVTDVLEGRKIAGREIVLACGRFSLSTRPISCAYTGNGSQMVIRIEELSSPSRRRRAR